MPEKGGGLSRSCVLRSQCFGDDLTGIEFCLSPRPVDHFKGLENVHDSILIDSQAALEVQPLTVLLEEMLLSFGQSRGSPVIRFHQGRTRRIPIYEA